MLFLRRMFNLKLNSRIMIASSNANKCKHFICHVYLKEIVLAKYWYDYGGYYSFVTRNKLYHVFMEGKIL